MEGRFALAQDFKVSDHDKLAPLPWLGTIVSAQQEELLIPDWKLKERDQERQDWVRYPSQGHVLTTRKLPIKSYFLVSFLFPTACWR